MDWIADGHKLTITLAPDYTLDVRVLCPGDCHLWTAERPQDSPDCWVDYMVDGVGSEFLEWWQTRDNEHNVPVWVTSDGAIEFEWRFDGEEMDWRPVKAPHHNEHQWDDRDVWMAREALRRIVEDWPHMTNDIILVEEAGIRAWLEEHELSEAVAASARQLSGA